MKKNIDNSVFAVKTRIAIILGAIIISAVIGGSLRFGQSFPTTVSADTTFSEQPLAGISDPATVGDEQNNIEIYRSVAPGVVLISNKGEQSDYWGEREEQSGMGSGVVIDDKGHILTNEHVVKGARNLVVNLGGDKVFPGRLIGSDPDTDLAVIKIEAPSEQLTVIPVGNSDALTVGQKVLAIGNPFGLDRTLTTGVISGLQRPIRSRSGKPIEGAIQTDASINPGNSGGPLLDKFGRMIGVNSQILSPSGASNGIGFAIPASIVKRIVPQLIQSGKVDRPQLGVGTKSVAELSRQGIRLPVENGLLVVTVAAGSAAEKAGLRGTTQDYNGQITLGDFIIGVDGQAIKSVDELYRAIDRHRIGDTLQLEVWRDGARTTVTVKLEASTIPNEQLPNDNPMGEKRPKTQRRY